MKKLIILFVLFITSSFFSEKEAYNTDVNFGVFYNSLSPYGEWIQLDYDVAVWKPYRVGRNWSPYSVGQWEYTNQGWYWDSYEPFGWATYHYGRWYYDDYYGWVWLPGYTWGPSWVEWRYSDSYIGWSPLPPYADFDVRVGIHFSFNRRSNYHHWHFVQYNSFCHPNVYNYFAPGHYKHRIFKNTKYRTNYHYNRGRVYNGGVDRRYVENRAGRRINERSIHRTNELRDYTNSRSRSNDRIIAYQPDEREARKHRNIQTGELRNGMNRSSLKKDMVTFRDRGNPSADRREINTGRGEERKQSIQKQDRYEIKNNGRNNGRTAERDRNRIEASKRSSKSYEGTRPQVNRRTDTYERKGSSNSPRKKSTIERQRTQRNETKSYKRNESPRRKPSIERQRTQRKETRSYKNSGSSGRKAEMKRSRPARKTEAKRPSRSSSRSESKKSSRSKSSRRSRR